MIALCMNTPGMDEVQWMTHEYGKKYPGAGWMRCLPILFQGGIPRFVDGKNALHRGNDLGVQADQFIVIQEENNPYGQELVRLGADPRVLICLESPIYASSFYDKIPQYFKHRLLFGEGTEHVYFPSFDQEDLQKPVPWNDRKFLCMVMANKHYKMLGDVPGESFKTALKTQLHDYRYEAINYFFDKPGFDLYGKGWPSAEYWPLSREIIGDKLNTIRNYKFSLCFENGSYPGYATEKIIDCFASGVIPVYKGAPDVTKYIDPDLFIDANQFKSFEAMEDYLRHAASDPVFDSMSTYGQKWLMSDAGQRFNNKQFAHHILELCA